MSQPPEGFATPQPAGDVPGPLAEWVDRVVATLIDFVIVLALGFAVFIVSAIVGIISDALGAVVAWLGYLGVSLWWLYLGYLEGVRGQSPGKAIQGLKVVKIADGAVLGGGMGIVRRIAHFVDGIICYLGFLLPLVDARKQTIADKMLETVVLRDQEKRPLSQGIFMP
jgi:uncharacterized RDD family membrane protein YckC